MTSTPGPGRRPLRRRLLFASIGVVAFVVMVELLSLGLFLAVGGGFSFSALHAAQASRTTAAAPPAHEQVLDPGEGRRLHPYLGYVLDQAVNDPAANALWRAPIGSEGFRTGASPVLDPDPRRLRVAVVGGSVASMLAHDGARALEDALRAHPAYAHRRVDVVSLALGGYKQPQQLLAVAYVLGLGGTFDVVVNLDGFNEVCMLWIEGLDGWPPARPRGWDVLVDTTPDPEVRRLVGRVDVLEDVRASAARWMSGPWRWSVTCNLVWKSLDGAIGGSITAAHTVVEERQRARPRADADVGGTEEDPERMPELVALWQQCSRQLAGLCAANGIEYFHFLQPNQYDAGSKPLNAEERRNAYAPDVPFAAPVALGYPLLRAAGGELLAEGIRFTDLSMLFEDEEETRYVDACCHFNPQGSEEMARAIAARILAEVPAVEVAAPAPTALRVEPAELDLDRPLARRPLRVLGADPDGGESDLTYAATRYASSDPAVAAVDRWGEVEARGAGAATVTVSRGEFRVDVPVRVTLPPVADLGGAISPRAGEALRLRVESRDGEMVFTVSGVTEPRVGVLHLALAPSRDPLCGGMAFVDLQGRNHQLVQLAAGATEVAMPAPATSAVQTFYAQVIVPEPDRRCAFAATNGLAITR